MTPIDRLADLIARTDFEPHWRVVADALIDVARAARGYRETSTTWCQLHDNANFLSPCTCETTADETIENAFDALDAAIVKALGES